MHREPSTKKTTLTIKKRKKFVARKKWKKALARATSSERGSSGSKMVLRYQDSTCKRKYGVREGQALPGAEAVQRGKIRKTKDHPRFHNRKTNLKMAKGGNPLTKKGRGEGVNNFNFLSRGDTTTTLTSGLDSKSLSLEKGM